MHAGTSIRWSSRFGSRRTSRTRHRSSGSSNRGSCRSSTVAVAMLPEVRYRLYIGITSREINLCAVLRWIDVYGSPYRRWCVVLCFWYQCRREIVTDLSSCRLASVIQVNLTSCPLTFTHVLTSCVQHRRRLVANQASDIKLGSTPCAAGKQLGSVSSIAWHCVPDTHALGRPYGMQEALEGFRRAAATHGWRVRVFL